MSIKFGIIGCAGMAVKFSRAILMSPNATLHAIGSRSLDKASKFAKDNRFPDTVKVYGSYEAVVEDPEVDVIHVALPTSLHLKWALMAAHNKKHILLNKPAALNVADLDAILEACESAGVQFMDATMNMHHPRTSNMKEFLSDHSRFGDFKSAYSVYSFSASEDFFKNSIRVKPDLDALGALGDIGWYCIRAILWATDFHLPKSVLALPGTVLNQAGVIMACKASLNWEDGSSATFECSFMGNMLMDVIVVGTKGTLHIRDNIIPFEEGQASFFTTVKSSFSDAGTRWGPKPSEHVVTTKLPQEALMITELSRLVGSIKYDGAKPDKNWGTICRKTQLIVDAVKASIDKDHNTVKVQN